MKVRLRCTQCRHTFLRERGQVRNPKRQFCSQKCFGLSRRTQKPPKAVRVALKAEYDREYREKHRLRLKRNKAAWFKKNYDPEKQRAFNAARMQQHVEYCRIYYEDPKRKAHKVRYDKRRQGLMQYGEYARAWRLLLALEREIRKRTPSYYERRKARGYYEINKTCQQRRRDANASRW